MSIAIDPSPRIQEVFVDDESVTARLADGRVISIPLAWSWRLSDATALQRSHFQIIADGYGIHWPELDEDISAEGMLHGSPAPRPKTAA